MSTVVTLNNGIKMPLVGLGCWKIPNETCAQQVYDAIRVGYRLFDGAEDYGNEKEVGQGIRRAIKEGIVKREDVVVISKLWNSYHHPKNVKLALKRTLSDLALDYLDIFYIHFPIALKPVPMEEKYPPGCYTGKEDAKEGRLSEEHVPIIDTYRALEECVDEGLIKSIGISNFSGSIIMDLLRGARIKPVALQIEHHPYLTQERLVKWVQSQGIQVVAYSSFGPQSFIEMGSELAKTTPPLFENPTIKKIADRHNVATSQVLLRWATQNGVAVIPKSSKKERLTQNLQIDNHLTLSQAELKEISGLNKNLRFNDPYTWSEKTPFPIFD
ncbi:probable NADPH-dependent aldose reductase GRE3 [Zygosaccharomyces bailii ISA1307]|nr:probable NADPH-dependent aldose reductase GRE3 [Zygosaccharomyces bailii ISA1307]